MAELQELLKEIPEGAQYQLIRDTLSRIARTFPSEMSEIDEARVARFVEDVDNGTRSPARIRADMFNYIVGADKIQSELGVDAQTAQQLISGEAQFAQLDSLTTSGDIGSAANPDVETAPLTILHSPTLKWYKDPETNKWYASYQLTASGREYIFEAEPDQMVAIFGDDGAPDAGFTTKTVTQLSQDPNFTFGGNIGEVEGTGSMEAAIRRVKATALDEGTLPQWAKDDPAAEDLFYIAQMEGKSTDWTVDQVLKLPSAQKRFPGLQNLRNQGLTGSEAVTAFLEFEQGVRSAQRQLGLPEEAVTPEVVGGLIGQGYSLTQVQDTYTQFKRMDDFAPALSAFNDILVANGKEPLTSTKEKFDFLQGNAPAEVYDIYEASSFREAAVQSGLGDIFTGADAIEAALQTQGVTSLETATKGMQSAAQMLLRLRHEVNTSEYGLEQDDLVDLSLGLAPRSGRTQAEIMQSVERATSAARAFVDNNRANPFRNFGAGGRVEAASLQAGRTQT